MATKFKVGDRVEMTIKYCSLKITNKIGVPVGTGIVSAIRSTYDRFRNHNIVVYNINTDDKVFDSFRECPGGDLWINEWELSPI